MEQVREAIRKSQEYLLKQQAPEGFWVAELEADSTLTSECLMLNHFLGRLDLAQERKAVRYLLQKQLPDGGWPIYHGGPSELSCTVKAYFALKLAGEPLEAPHMEKARANILSKGGAVKANVFTRIALALFGQCPWKGVPAMPVELALLPRTFLYEISYWSRTVLMPLLIIFAKRPLRRLSLEQGIRELYVAPPEEVAEWFEGDKRWMSWRNVFLGLDRLLRAYDAHPMKRVRAKALKRAEAWILERMRGSGGLGAIYPAMANSVWALVALGYPMDHPLVAKALREIDELIVEDDDSLHPQPCFSPVWDTANAIIALVDSGLDPSHPLLQRAARWLLSQQIATVGDWAVKRPGLTPGGWYFQYENTFYPDCDDTAMVLMALHRVKLPTEEHEIQKEGMDRGFHWLLGMQSKNGGWGAYDADNDKLFFNEIPFADHKALLDPPTSDVTARVLELMGQLGYDRTFPPASKALDFLKHEQEPEGCWYGRWGVNYIYGTWSVLSALNAISEDMNQPYVRRAVQWLKATQNPDGGWGETCKSYEGKAFAGVGESTPSQTAWALLGLLAAGEARSEPVRRGIRYLVTRQRDEGDWVEESFTGTGFPRVFYLRYHMYRIYFPLLALGRALL
ncbi:MAG: squalene--hopene cyclase [candidate division NC10 bacterium]|nr:squalene--hopene cyclase [candidate division NC10 bacterium]